MTGRARLQRELLAALEATLGTLERAHADTREAATHAEARPENDKDTRALEASYLARGQAERIEVLQAGLRAVRAMPLEAPPGLAACLGSLVDATEDGEPVRYFLAPEGGGLRLSGGVQVITPRSPLGQALLGQRAGDELELRLAGRIRTLEVTRVA
jgi:transcription elongation GreA/GreB family factor